MSRVPRPLTIAAAKEQARSIAMAAAEPLSYVVLGEPRVYVLMASEDWNGLTYSGKTNIIRRLIGQTYYHNTLIKAPAGLEGAKKAEKEIATASAVVIVFSLADPDTFHSVRLYLDIVRRIRFTGTAKPGDDRCGKPFTVLLIASKWENRRDRRQEEDQARLLAEAEDFHYQPVSARLGEGRIQLAFMRLTEELLTVREAFKSPKPRDHRAQPATDLTDPSSVSISSGRTTSRCVPGTRTMTLLSWTDRVNTWLQYRPRHQPLPETDTSTAQAYAISIRQEDGAAQPASREVGTADDEVNNIEMPATSRHTALLPSYNSAVADEAGRPPAYSRDIPPPTMTGEYPRYPDIDYVEWAFSSTDLDRDTQARVRAEMAKPENEADILRVMLSAPRNREMARRARLDTGWIGDGPSRISFHDSPSSCLWSLD